MAQLGAAVRTGALWSGLAQLGQQGLSVLGTLILVRILAPGDFGVVALGASVIAFAQIAANLGFGAALIRRHEIPTVVVQTALWLSLVTALVLGAALTLVAPAVATLLGQPQATDYLRLVGVLVALSMSAAVPSALLQRAMRFRPYALVQLASTCSYVFVEVALALAGFGAISVVIGQLVMALVNLLGWAGAARVRPRMSFSLAVARETRGFAGAWSGLQAASFVGKNADYWAVSRVLGPEQLGVYYVAFVLPALIRQRLNYVVQSVLFPVFSRLDGDLAKTADAYWRVVRLQLSVAVPALLGLALLSQPLVAVLFGTQWQDAAPAITILSLAALVTTCGQTLAGLALAQGAMRRNLEVQLVNAVLVVLAVVMALFVAPSVTSVAGGVLVASIATLAWQQCRLGPALGLSARPLVTDLLRLSPPAAVMIGGLLAVTHSRLGGVGQLAVGTVIGALLFGTAARWMAPQQVQPLVLELARLRRKRRRSTPASGAVVGDPAMPLRAP